MKIEQEYPALIYAQEVAAEKIKSRRLLKEMFQKQSQFKFFGWGFQENYTYITYLKYFMNIFQSPQTRKQARVFTHLSKLLTTRTSSQIKCHHQKMINRHKSINGIIEHLKLKIIKYLKNHSEAKAEIQKINKVCQNFFIQEDGFQLRVKHGLQHKKNKFFKEGKKESKHEQKITIKEEDSMDHYAYRELKPFQFSEERPKIQQDDAEATVK